MTDNVLALIAATAALVVLPGPNAALIVANSLSHGLRFGLVTVVGTTFGIALQLALVIAGMAAVIELAGSALVWIKWLGVLYLLYLGFTTWREGPRDGVELVQA
jgi:threonine/homoserine/homoserine lactone efflux protein